ncbi:MAG: hypothetical protein ACKOZU_09855 [Planctomycetaceae bacterium]
MTPSAPRGGLAPATVRRRPPMFRALGRRDPPETLDIDGERFVREEILKHDSWAATAIYASPARRAICKFNRESPVAFVPMRWLGRLLAVRERGFMERLRGVAGVPAGLGAIRVDGEVVPTAVGRTFVDGHALGADERVDDTFFPRLVAILAEVHRRGIAHVDLHKRENILVDDAGRPQLIDFQISWGLPRGRIAAACLRPLLAILQQCDDYHLLKHRLRLRPDQLPRAAADLDSMRPTWIRLHRLVAVPFRTLRRGLLVRLGIRSPSGHAHSEAFPEVAHRLGPLPAVR